MFSGSVRDNLDPLHEYSDRALWDALRHSQLAVKLSAHPLKLAAPLTSLSLSAGQQQLLCLARALVKKPRCACALVRIL